MKNESNEIIINSTIGNTRIVLTRNQVIEQIFIELKNFESKATIILAPACSSFDQFINFEQRGEKFKEIVMKKIHLS